MAALDNLYVRVANDIVHDLAAATALASPVVALIAHAKATVPDTAGAAAVASSFMWMGVAALAVLVFTGSVRLRYWSAPIAEQARDARARAATIKHAVFVVVVLLGFALSIWAASAGPSV